MSETRNKWTEKQSKFYIENARYFVPERELQIETICSLISPPKNGMHLVLDLCCGEGLLDEVILKKYPNIKITGLDGSNEMLCAAKKKLSRFKNKFSLGLFDIASKEWRNHYRNLYAVVSTIAIHHLSNQEKRQLFKDVYSILKPHGRFIIADIILPATKASKNYAANQWNNIVKLISLKLDGNTLFFKKFKRKHWNYFQYADPVDKPSAIFEQLKWLKQAGFSKVDVFWMKAGHSVFGGFKE